MSMSATRRLQWPSERGLLPDNGLMGMLWSAYYAGTDMDRWSSNCPPRVRHASVCYISEQCLFSIPFSPIPNANVDFSASASFNLEIFPPIVYFADFDPLQIKTTMFCFHVESKFIF